MSKVHKRKWITSKGEPREAWEVDYFAYDPETKKMRRRHKNFPTKREATAWWEDNVKGVREKTHVPDSQSITVSDMADIWITAVTVGRGERGPAEASTLRQYNYHKDLYIVPPLGHLKLCDLTQAVILDFKAKLLAGHSRSLARKVMTSLKGLLNEAVTQQKVAVNVAREVSIGKDKRDITKAKVPALEHIRLILAELDTLGAQPNVQRAKAWRRYRAIIATAIHTGMRASEVRGLPWAAVDFDAGKIHVRQRADENGDVAEVTKSDAGYRSIPVPASLLQMLKQWKLEAGGHALVFATKSGEPMSLPNIYNRAWKPLQISLGLTNPLLDRNGDIQRDDDGKPLVEPLYNFHLLRHFHASMLIADNANPKEVQSEMGHSDIKITYDLYGHLFVDEESDKRRQQRSERLANLLG
ncbi:site-specific integrase [Rhizobium sp. 007]|uniref:tyrosine-type recombinase/integrase n=1 Tax=Rhizobium sp. 007 TaxID=2785056 RepID=UPI0018904F4E|nr:site-specific integrase [Rhizobium sp. 007]QPB20194.1 tyrosine-type recombinase/integrase [Rhizobium sp. 007]